MCTLERAQTVFTRSYITPPKVNQFGWNLEQYIVWGRPWQILGAIRTVARFWERCEFLFLFQVNNARLYLYLYPSAKFHEIWTQHVVRWGNESFRNRISFPWGVVFSKTQEFDIFFNVLRLQAAITPQRLHIDGNSLPNDSSVGYPVPFLPSDSVQSHSLGLYTPYKKPTPKVFLRRTPHHGIPQCHNDDGQVGGAWRRH